MKYNIHQFVYAKSHPKRKLIGSRQVEEKLLSDEYLTKWAHLTIN